MPGTIRFSQVVNLSDSSDEAALNTKLEPTSLIDLLSIIQYYSVSLLPISPHTGLGIVGRGRSGDIFQSIADISTTLTFKNAIPSRRICDDNSFQDWYSLATELCILQYPPVRANIHIVSLIGIVWDVDARQSKAWPYTLTSKVSRGSLASFLTQESIDDAVRLQIFCQVMEAFRLLHDCGIGHGDVKPDNILVNEDKEGKISCQVTDFGSAAIRGQVRIPEGTPLWNAPELQRAQQGYISADKIMLSDLYSIGFLTAHILIPMDSLKTHDMFFIDSTPSTNEKLQDLQMMDFLRDKILSIARNSNIPILHQRVLEEAILNTLIQEPNHRKLDWVYLAYLLGKEGSFEKRDMFPLIPPSTFFAPTISCSHRVFDIVDALSQLDDVDYVLRHNITMDLESKVRSSPCFKCAQQYAFQLAICYTIGFGVRRAPQQSQSWLQRAAMKETDLASSIGQIKEKYQLTGNLSQQVRNSLSLGLLVTTNRTDQYRKEKRLVEAEESLSLEIDARKLAFGESDKTLLQLKIDLAQIYVVQARFKKAELLQQDIIWMCQAVLPKRHPLTLSSISALATTLIFQGRLVEAEMLQRDLQVAHIEVLGQVHPDTITVSQNLARTLTDLGRHEEATNLLQQVSEARTETLGKHHPLTIRAELCFASSIQHTGLFQKANDIMALVAAKTSQIEDPVIKAYTQMCRANMFRDLNLLEEAEEAARRAIKVFRRKFKEDDSMKLEAEEVLATIRGYKKDFKEEEIILRTVLKFRAPLDKQDPSILTLRTKQMLASNLLKQGKVSDALIEAKEVVKASGNSPAIDPSTFLECIQVITSGLVIDAKRDQAEALKESSLESCRLSLGEEHPFTIVAKANLAKFFSEQGSFHKAIKLQKEILEAECTKGPLGLTAINAAGELAWTLVEQGEIGQAADLCNNALSWCSSSIGPHHPQTLAVNVVLLKVYIETGNYPKARELFDTKLRRAVIGKNMEIQAISTYASLCYREGQHEEAIEMEQQAIHLALGRVGPQHPIFLRVKGNALGTRLEGDLTRELEMEVLENLQLKRMFLGPYHLSTIKTITDLAYAYGRHGRLKDAKQLYKDIEEDGGETSHEALLWRAAVCVRRADLYFRQEQYQESQKLEEEALEIRSRILPEGHETVELSMMNLASVLNAQGEYKEAERYIRIVLEARERRLGPDAPLTLRAKNDLAAVLYGQGNLEDSEKLFSDVVEASERMNESPEIIASRIAQLRLIREQRKTASMS